MIITFKSIKKLNQFISLIDEKVKFNIIGLKDDIIDNQLNLLVNENELSFEFFSINTILLNEENLYKGKERKKIKLANDEIEITNYLNENNHHHKSKYVVDSTNSSSFARVINGVSQYKIGQVNEHCDGRSI